MLWCVETKQSRGEAFWDWGTVVGDCWKTHRQLGIVSRGHGKRCGERERGGEQTCRKSLPRQIQDNHHDRCCKCVGPIKCKAALHERRAAFDSRNQFGVVHLLPEPFTLFVGRTRLHRVTPLPSIVNAREHPKGAWAVQELRQADAERLRQQDDWPKAYNDATKVFCLNSTLSLNLEHLPAAANRRI